jgi:hypothetical integral membrane protein (TIGR02206 family)
VPPHHVYGLFHLAWIAGIVSLSIALSLVCRRNLIPHLYVRAALICLLVGGELQRYMTADVRFPGTLPLNLCNIATWAAVIACLTLSPAAVEFAYFAGFSGAGMALVTPDMGPSWPTAFFLNHGAIILAGSALVYGRISPLRQGAMWRAAGYTWLYTALIELFDWRFGVNYFYQCRKPAAGTMLDYLGPWPFYILATGAVGHLLYWLLWLPVRPRTSVVPGPQPVGTLAISHAGHS